MLKDEPGPQAEIDGCCAAIMELGMVRDGSTIAERKATRLDELNHLSYVNDAAGYVTALYALLALARCEMDANKGASGPGLATGPGYAERTGSAGD